MSEKKKTKEELDILRDRCLKLSEQMKELDDEELSIVTGGTDGRATRTINGVNFWGHVRKYNGVNGQYYYITEDGTDDWWSGWLTYSYEKNFLFFTMRYHKFETNTHRGKIHDPEAEEFCGDGVTLYLNSDAKFHF